MASSSFNMETVAGLTPIFVSKTVSFPANTNTTVDLSEFIPQGKIIRAIGPIKLGNYIMPYIGENNAVTYLQEIKTGTALYFVNRAPNWNNFTLTPIIYDS